MKKYHLIIVGLLFLSCAGIKNYQVIEYDNYKGFSCVSQDRIEKWNKILLKNSIFKDYTLCTEEAKKKLSKEKIKKAKALCEGKGKKINKKYWTLKSLLDVFGDETKSKYIVSKKIKGVFGNSATTNSGLVISLKSELEVSLFVSGYSSYGNNTFFFNLIEDDSKRKKNIFNNNEIWTFKIKDDKSKVHSLKGVRSVGSISITEKYRGKFHSLMVNNKKLKIIIKNNPYTSKYEKYSFAISGVGYCEAFNNL